MHLVANIIESGCNKNFMAKRISCSYIFLGDSAGSTDYKFGLSVGRGFLAVDRLINSMQEYHYDFDEIASNYQTYWNKIISCEFNKGPFCH